MLRRSLLLSLLALLSWVPGKACTCGYVYPDLFASLAAYFSAGPPATLAVVKGVVTGTKDGYGMKLCILADYYHGDSVTLHTGDTSVIWGDPGWMCRFSPVGYYLPGDTVIGVLFSLKHMTPATASESQSDYYMNLCALDNVKVVNDSVFGGHVTSFTFGGYPQSPFLDSLHTFLSGQLSVPGLPARAIHTWPNPANGIVHIDAGRSLPGATEVRLYNSAGLQVLQHRHAKGGPIEIDVSDLPPGAYLLRWWGKDGSAGSGNISVVH